MTKKLIAEALGTFILVFFGCGAAVIAGPVIGYTGIALAFGLAIVAAAYGLGAISGAHLNPAVSLGHGDGRADEPWRFCRLCGSASHRRDHRRGVLMIIASGTASWTGGLGANGFGPGYLGEYSLTAALVFEFVMTFLFVTVILGATATGAPAAMAGLAIGLTLAAIHLVGINVTGVSVNPARSIGPAVFVGGEALAELWLFIVAPLAGGALAGIVHAAGLTRAGD